MNIEINLIGLDNITKELEKIKKKINSKLLFDYLAKKSIDAINEIAEKKLQNSSNYKQHNKYELLDNGFMIYNDVSSVDGTYYSLIIEYGSGTKMSSDSPGHIGQSNSFTNSGGKYWFVKADEVDLSSYGFEAKHFKSDGFEGDLYQVFGQEPKYIYTDAARIIQKNINKWFNEYILLDEEE